MKKFLLFFLVAVLIHTFTLIKVLVHEENNLVHVNWGDAGRDNGYFKGNLLANRQADSYDDPLLVNNDSVSMIYNFSKFYVIK